MEIEPSQTFVDLKMDRTPVRVYPDKIYIGSYIITKQQLAEIVKAQDELTPIQIDFKWEEFEEEDDVWDALLVSINNGRWLLAYSHFGIEDEEEIKKNINANKLFWKTFK